MNSCDDYEELMSEFPCLTLMSYVDLHAWESRLLLGVYDITREDKRAINLLFK
jgi:hypothetical protein